MIMRSTCPSITCSFRDKGREEHPLLSPTQYRLLASRAPGYEPTRWHRVKLVLQGPRLTVFFDDQQDFEIRDDRYPSGTVAAYAWGNAGVSFRTLRFRELH